MTETAQKQYTSQEIEDHCERLKIVGATTGNDYDLLTIRIIRQLQAEAIIPKCGSCGEPVSSDCPTCKRLWES